MNSVSSKQFPKICFTFLLFRCYTLSDFKIAANEVDSNISRKPEDIQKLRERTPEYDKMYNFRYGRRARQLRTDAL